MQDGCDPNEDLAFDFLVPAAATVLGSVVSKDTPRYEADRSLPTSRMHLFLPLCNHFIPMP
jgi:hypothetical protein